MARANANTQGRVSGELFTLTYGSLVAQLIKDYEEPSEVNKQLEKMGHNIGMRLIDDFLAHEPVEKSRNLEKLPTSSPSSGSSASWASPRS